MLISEQEVASFIPHREPFVLVDGLESADDVHFQTRFTVRSGHILVRDGRLSEAGMLENIAQSAALGFGYSEKKSGGEPKVGYIGGISRVEVFALPAVGDTITTQVEVTHRLGPVVMVCGKCCRNDEILLQGEIKLVI